ncbi:MAG: hypothetical protein HY746_07930 [Elusimicrobia bacterium]|nr:hypothetical protein [Elusimicrobiota bacterium]
MKKVMFSFIAACFLFSQILYAIPVSDAEFFSQLTLADFSADEPVKQPVEKQQTADISAKPPETKSQYVSVSGYVHLTGSGWVPGTNGGFTTVNMTGWATFRDSSGKVTSNNTYVNVLASMWIYPNQYVFQTVWPNVHVQFYKDGKYVGSANMTGSISVSGWPTGSFVHLNGSGYLNGSLYIQ